MYFEEVLRVIQEEVFMEFLESFKGVTKSFQCVSRKFKGCIETISRVFQESFQGVSGVFLKVFEGSSKAVLKPFQDSFWWVSTLPGVLWKFQQCFNKSVSMKFQGSVLETSPSSCPSSGSTLCCAPPQSRFSSSSTAQL